ncbi:MAG: LPS assembly protein LptD [Nitrospirota bacterium]|nr:LPS assembly protein LptD [Nitrospirota bacterium]MDP2384438.1 LPS assembly protein LptD [Nitrospirota bacterium]
MVRRLSRCLAGWLLVGLLFPVLGHAVGNQAKSVPVATSSGGLPLDITAERIDYLQEQETYEANGSVVVNQGTMRLTADHMTIHALPGVVIATGHVRLIDPKADLAAERLELNVNTEAGVVTHGRVYLKASNTSVEGRLMQRFSEDHYRVKEGRFTNCDAQEGETPAWRFEFKDLDLNAGDHVGFTGGWLCVNDVPVVPIPTMTYPLSSRRSGFLIPNIGYDNRFGTHLQESFYWAINPSQDLTISPSYYSSLGYGSDFEYRYVLDQKSRGQWFISYLQQTKLPNVSGVTDNGGSASQSRALIAGTHTQQFTPDLLLRAQISFVTDPNYLQQLSNSGAQRALPSSENNILATQRLPYGNLYFLGQYLQPLQAGGKDTFQRLPETGYSLPNLSLFNSPLLLGLDSNYVNFYREQGFTLNRVDVMPGLTTDVIDLGHIIGLTPQVKVREVYYTRGVESSNSQHRETLWAGLDATSKLSRRFGVKDGGSFLHTLEPSVVYEYVPPTDQSKITQIDQVDDLPKKNLLTYALRSRLLEQAGSSSFNWLDFTMAQSYHVGATQTRARDFTPGASPQLGSITQPLQPATVAIDGKKLSDLWMRAVIGNTTPQFTPAQLAGAAFGRGAGVVPGQQPALNQYLTIDTFIDPYRSTVSQFNTDLRVQQSNYWYMEVGQRFSRDGNRVRRGDIWNPISFNEVYAPTTEIQFVTAGGGFRTPWGWTIGAKGYYDVKNGKSPEYDVVALYQNPCKCWSLGLYYLQFPDRAQYNFMLSLTGIGWTENFGTAVLRSILSPLLVGEKGLPWAAPGGPYGRAQSLLPQTGMGGVAR